MLVNVSFNMTTILSAKRFAFLSIISPEIYKSLSIPICQDGDTSTLWLDIEETSFILLLSYCQLAPHQHICMQQAWFASWAAAPSPSLRAAVHGIARDVPSQIQVFTLVEVKKHILIIYE